MPGAATRTSPAASPGHLVRRLGLPGRAGRRRRAVRSSQHRSLATAAFGPTFTAAAPASAQSDRYGPRCPLIVRCTVHRPGSGPGLPSMSRGPGSLCLVRARRCRVRDRPKHQERGRPTKDARQVRRQRTQLRRTNSRARPPQSSTRRRQRRSRSEGRAPLGARKRPRDQYPRPGTRRDHRPLPRRRGRLNHPAAISYATNAQVRAQEGRHQRPGSAVEGAERLGLPRPQIVHAWARRYSDFPRPHRRAGDRHDLDLARHHREVVSNVNESSSAPPVAP